MADIKFKSAAHRDFFLENMMKSRVTTAITGHFSM